MSQGYRRDLTRQQAQRPLHPVQDRFDGGENSDSPASKIAPYELALAENVIPFRDYLEGGYARRLFSTTRVPGTGAFRGKRYQHPTSKRVLMHRDGKLFLSTSAACIQWEEVTPIGPDGYQEAIGTFTYTDGTTELSGPAAAFLSDLVVAGSVPGYTYGINIAHAGGTSFTVELMYGDDLEASGGDAYAGTPNSLVLAEYAGSGISATVDIAELAFGDVPLNGVVVMTSTSADITFNLRGLTADNTDNFNLYWDAIVDGTDLLINIYKDVAKTQLVATITTFTNFSGIAYVVPANDSGISGSIPVNTFVGLHDGTYAGTTLTFSGITASISAPSKIDYQDDGFVVFVRGTPAATLFVDQRINKYWFLSTAMGYGQEPLRQPNPNGDYKRRYLVTFSRIIDITTGLPAYGGDRNTNALLFEGPSNLAGTQATDFMSYESTTPWNSDNPKTLTLRNADNEPFGLNAAAYITHQSIYGTADTGPNGINPTTGEGNQSELYVWIADVPIYSTSYTDETDDAALRFRFGGDQNGFYTLKSRFFTEMAKGIGAMGPDFMFTASYPTASRVEYCSLTYPRLLGYYYNGADGQFYSTDYPVEQILRTKRYFVLLGEKNTTVGLSSVYVEPGSGFEYRPVIKDWDKSSHTIGIKSHDGWCVVDETSFAALCNDGTVRKFSGSSWGEPLDAPSEDQDGTVHKLTAAALPGSCLGFIRDTLRLFYHDEEDAETNDKTIRYGFGGFAGSRWAREARDNWVHPPVGTGGDAIVDADGIERLVVVDDDCLFAIEEPEELRQIEDDEVDQIVDLFEGFGAGFLYNQEVTLPDPKPPLVYGDFAPVGDGTYKITLYADEALTEVVAESAAFLPEDQPLALLNVAEVDDSGISMIVDVFGFFPTPATFTIRNGLEISGTTPIKGRFRLGGLTGVRPNQTVEHEESHVKFEPSGAAFPDGFGLTMRGYADGVLVPGAEVAGPLNGDLQYRARVRGTVIQNEYETTASGFRVTSIDTRFQSHDMQLPTGPSNTSEFGYQRDLARGNTQRLFKTLGKNLATGLPYTLEGMAPTLLNDMTGRPRAMSFAEGKYVGSQALLETATVMAWIRPTSAGVTILNISGDNSLLIRSTDGDLTGLEVSMGGEVQTIPAVLNQETFTHIAVTKTQYFVKIYVAGVLVTTVEYWSTFAGETFETGTDGFDLCDLVVKDIELSVEALAYYVRDVQTNQGKKVLG